MSEIKRPNVPSLRLSPVRADAGPVWADPKMGHVMEIARRVALTPSTVLIHGESGVGKEVMAQFIHRSSPRVRGPMLAINCAALPQGVLESELFGHEKGAFSGAVARHQGVFERADGGTIFLDEISEVSLEVQAKLLRVLQERTMTRVGGHQEIKLDLRIIAATNKNLMQCVTQGTFRQDLFYRLNVFPLSVPPLRARPQDIEALTLYYLSVLAQRFEVSVEAITQRALDRIMRYPFPGNVRELVNLLERATILAFDTPIIDLEHVMFDTDDMLVSTTSSGEERVIEPDELVSFLPGDEPLTDVRRKIILQTLKRFQGNRTKTAEALGVSLRTVRNKLRDYREHGHLSPGLLEDTDL